ncbi:MAG: hypothetical protein AAF614_41875, partial [Chloroflexota bacterium]
VLRFLLPEHPHLTADLQPVYVAHAARAQQFAASASEFENGRSVSAAQAGVTGKLGTKPLVVITAQNSFDAFRTMSNDLPFAESNAVWQTLQADLATLSDNRVHLISETADHNVNFTDSAIILQGLAQMLTMIDQSQD